MVSVVVTGLIFCLRSTFVCHLNKGILINTPALLLLQQLAAAAIVRIREAVVRQRLERARLLLLLLRQLDATCVVFGGHETLRLDLLSGLLRLGRLVELLAGMGRPALLHAQLGE